jgi:hypothetical protein
MGLQEEERDSRIATALGCGKRFQTGSELALRQDFLSSSVPLMSAACAPGQDDN